MGWSTEYMRGMGVKEYLTWRYESTPGMRVLDSSVKGGVGFFLVETSEGVRLFVDKYERSGDHVEIKGMSESEGPYCYGCPKRILDKADKLIPPVGFAAEWREKCRAGR